MKGLEAIIYLRECLDDKYYSNEISIIEKELKALEIIKNKKVNVSLFFSTDSLNAYNDYIARCRGAGIVREAQLLTQQEYDLLKEVLGE